MNIKNVKSVVVLFSLLIAFFAGASRTPGQEVTAAVTGTVVDPAGAPIQGASVSAKDVDRGVVFTGETNGDGVYYLARVPVGRYEVRVEAKGFQPNIHY